MTTYFSTYISGMGLLIEKELKNKLSDVRIIESLDGLIIYSTNADFKLVKKLPFYNNSFLLLDEYKASNVNSLFNNVLNSKLKKYGLSVGKFRIIYSKKNTIITIDKNILRNLEKYFSKYLKAKVDRAAPDCEVWFLERSEGKIYVGIRISKNVNEKTLKKGELRPELAYLMCSAAEIKPTDRIMDPFSGSGSIPKQVARHFDFEKLFVFEKNKQIVLELRNKFKKNKSKIVVGRMDALKLKSLSDSSIDKVITDPPWGIFDKSLDTKNFYKKMLTEFYRLLKNKGIIVLLTAQKEIFKDLVSDDSNFKILEEFNVLVTGKKAGLYVIEKL